MAYANKGYARNNGWEIASDHLCYKTFDKGIITVAFDGFTTPYSGPYSSDIGAYAYFEGENPSDDVPEIMGVKTVNAPAVARELMDSDSPISLDEAYEMFDNPDDGFCNPEDALDYLAEKCDEWYRSEYGMTASRRKTSYMNPPFNDSEPIGATSWLAYGVDDYKDIPTEALRKIANQRDYRIDNWWYQNSSIGEVLTAVGVVEYEGRSYSIYTHQYWNEGEMESIGVTEPEAAKATIEIAAEHIIKSRGESIFASKKKAGSRKERMTKMSNRSRRSKRASMRKMAQSSAYSIFIGAVEDPVNGTWVDLPASDDEIQEAIETAQNGPDGEFYEEVMIADVSGLGNGVGEYDNIEQVNEWVTEIDDAGLPEDLVETLLEYYGLEEIADNAYDIEYYTDVNSDSDLAYELVDQLGGVEELGSETLARYFDYEGFGRDLRLGDGYEIANGFGFRVASRRTASRMMLCNIVEKHVRKANAKMRRETARRASSVSRKNAPAKRSANRSRKNRRHLPLR